jgi:taurine dioxygenase
MTLSSLSRPWTARKLTPHLGAEIPDVDLRDIARAADRQPLVNALTEHGVVVFRDQSLTPDDLMAVSGLLGDFERHVHEQFRMADRPDVYVLSNIVENGKPVGNPKDGFGWHTDQAYIARPTAYTMLYGVETPAEGADTMFTNTFAAFDALPAEKRAWLSDLRQIFSLAYMHELRVKEIGPLTEDQKRRTPDVTHPLIRRHPISGRLSLYVGSSSVRGIVGMPEAEARPLIEELFEHAIKPEFQYVHKWQRRDVVVWDNRGTMHTATEYDRVKYRRLVWRTSMIGEIPLGPMAA